MYTMTENSWARLVSHTGIVQVNSCTRYFKLWTHVAYGADPLKTREKYNTGLEDVLKNTVMLRIIFKNPFSRSSGN